MRKLFILIFVLGFFLLGIFIKNIPNYILVILGMGFVLFFTRVIPSLLLEIVFFGGLFGFIEAWKGWGSYIGIPDISNNFLVIFSTAIIFWAIARLIYVIGILWLPQLKIISNLLLGK